MVKKVGRGGCASLTLLALFLKNCPVCRSLVLRCVVVGRLSKFDQVARKLKSGGVHGRSGNSSPNAADGTL